MNRIVLGIFAVGFCFEFVSALECYKCGISDKDDLCTGIIADTRVNCTEGDLCYHGVGKAAGFIDIDTKGCLPKAKCNTTESVSFPGTKAKLYSLKRTCCDTDLCNAASRLPTATLLSLSLATLSTLIMAKILV